MATLSLDESPREQSEFTRKKLTRFLCQELLYEFVTHRLDSHREQEINEFLSLDRDSARELENLNKGLRYAQQASEVKISPRLREALLNFEPHWKKRLREWTLWSSQRGWKTLPYAFVAMALALGLFATKPWIKSLDEDVMLAEQLKKEPDMVPQPTPTPPAEPTTVPTVARAQAPGNVPPPALLAPPDTPSALAAPPAPAPAPVAKAPDPAPAPLPAPSPDPAAYQAALAEAKAGRMATDAEQMGRGFLFRAEIEVSDFHNSWPAIRDKVVALGGKVAGNVELGWLRKSTESYFHFTLPESNYSEFELFLGTFSPVRFSKDRHPRVMPEGQIRIILTVKDGMTTNEGSSETP